MSFHEGFTGNPYTLLLLQFLLAKLIIRALQAYYQNNYNVNQGLAPEENPGNESYSTSLIQQKPIDQCQEDLANEEDKSCHHEWENSARAIDRLTADIYKRFQSRMLVPVVLDLPNLLNNRGHNLDRFTGQQSRENAHLTGDGNSDSESIRCSENDDECGNTMKDGKTVKETEAGPSGRLDSHNEVDVAVDVMVKSAKIDDRDSATSDSSQDIGPDCDNESSNQHGEGVDTSSDSDGDASGSSSDIEEKTCSKSADTATGIVETVDEPAGIQDSIAVGDGIAVSNSTEVTPDGSDPLYEEPDASSDDALRFGDEGGALAQVETNNGNKVEDSKDREKSKEEFPEKLDKEGVEGLDGLG